MALVSRDFFKNLPSNICNFASQATAIELKSIVAAGVAFTAYITPADASSMISNKEIAKIIDTVRQPLLISCICFLFIKSLAFLINFNSPQKPEQLPPQGPEESLPNLYPLPHPMHTPLQAKIHNNAPIQNCFNESFLIEFDNNICTPSTTQDQMDNPDFILSMNLMSFEHKSILHAACDKPEPVSEYLVRRLLSDGAVLEKPIYRPPAVSGQIRMPCVMTSRQIQVLQYKIRDIIQFPKHTLIQDYRPTVNAILQILDTPSKHYPAYPSISPVLEKLTAEEKTELVKKLHDEVLHNLSQSNYSHRTFDIISLLLSNPILQEEKKHISNGQLSDNRLILGNYKLSQIFSFCLQSLKKDLSYKNKWEAANKIREGQ